MHFADCAVCSVPERNISSSSSLHQEEGTNLHQGPHIQNVSGKEKTRTERENCCVRVRQPLC